MSYITTYNKQVICPLWKEKISLCGKYLLSEEKGHEYEAKFISATCPILENIGLPRSQKDEKYSLFPFCDIKDCALLDDFDPVIDTRKR